MFIILAPFLVSLVFFFCIFNSIFNRIFVVQFAVLYFGAYPSSFPFQSASTGVFSVTMCVSQSSICCSFVVCLCQIFFFRNLSFLLPWFFFPSVFSFNPSFFPRFLPLYSRLHPCLIIRLFHHYLFSGFGVRISGHKFPRLLQF